MMNKHAPEGFEDQPNQKAWKVIPLRDSELGNIETVIERSIAYANLYPNAHNAQPVIVEASLNKREILVKLNPDNLSVASEFHPDRRQAHISAGCFQSFLCIALESFCHLPENITYIPDPMDKHLVSRIELPESPVSELTERTNLLGMIPERRTNRFEYDPQISLTEELLLEFESIRNRYSDLRIDELTDGTRKGALATLQYLADSAVVTMGEFSSELAKTLKENSTTDFRGMPVYGWGLGDNMAKQAIDQLSKGFQGSNKDAIFLRVFPTMDRDGITSAPSLFVISGSDTRENWVKTGEIYGEMTLRLTKHGYSSAPNAAPIESKVHNVSLKTMIGISPFSKTRPLMFFRAGKPTRPALSTPRQPVERILKWVE